ncbi:hypothetical protein NM688_g6280 [Phlebia brevispora]|uniref:Uncharacterized protein n=1 Tax=Phlebia brevispora TaxID=194682 RepID=A0ACC1SHS7_9APHY|nr:hypothetical protein NM688_g6280 [Phlebia brevispora]
MWTDDEDEEPFAGASEDEYGQAGPGSRGAKRSKIEQRDSRRGPGEYQNDDFVVADSDEEDGDFAEFDGGRKKKTRTHRDEEAEEDDLEKLEAKIEAEERKRRQEAGDKGSDKEDKAADEEAMDVESEDEDEWGVRRMGAGSRRKRAIEFEEEEED